MSDLYRKNHDGPCDPWHDANCFDPIGAERVPDGPRARSLTPHGYELWLIPKGDDDE